MKSQSHLFPIILMARLLRVSVSRFYDWLKRGMSKSDVCLKTGGFNLVNYTYSLGVYHEQETEDLHRRI